VSVAEIQELADKILERLGVSIRSGQMVVHYHDGRVQRVETNTVHKPAPRPTNGLHHRAQTTSTMFDHEQLIAIA
jgi:hypothetical protein